MAGDIDHDLLAIFQSMDDAPQVREEYVRSPFGYPGSKFRSLDDILPELPYRSRYGEPFGGSGKVLLARKSCPFEVLNDRYSGVTSFYRVLREPIGRDALIARLEEVCHSREEFIWSRDTWKDCHNPVERAARWFYMVRNSFGSQGRNFGRSVSDATMPRAYHNSLKLFPACSLRLRHVTVENQDWRQCLKDFDHHDMVWYIDPPYFKVCKGMYEIEMADADHVELLERIFHLQGFVALSGYPNELYNRYPWDHVKTWKVRTSTLGQAFTQENNLAGFEDALARKIATEALYIKEAV